MHEGDFGIYPFPGPTGPEAIEVCLATLPYWVDGVLDWFVVIYPDGTVRESDWGDDLA